MGGRVGVRGPRLVASRKPALPFGCRAPDVEGEESCLEQRKRPSRLQIEVASGRDLVARVGPGRDREGHLAVHHVVGKDLLELAADGERVGQDGDVGNVVVLGALILGG